MQKPCKWCGTLFEARGKARYCNDGCRIQWDRVNDKRRDKNPLRQLQKARIGARWYRANKAAENAKASARYYADHEQNKARARAYHAQKLSGEIVKRQCRCGATFWVKPTSRRYFCTRECRHRITRGVTVWIVELLRQLERGETLTAAQRCAGQR